MNTVRLQFRLLTADCLTLYRIVMPPGTTLLNFKNGYFFSEISLSETRGYDSTTNLSHWQLLLIILVLILKTTFTPVACVNNKNSQVTKLYYNITA